MHCSLINVVTENGKKMLKVIPCGTPTNRTGVRRSFSRIRRRKNKKLLRKSGGTACGKNGGAHFGRDIPTEFSLTDRTNMKFSILLGRKFLKKNFVVDVSLKDRSAKAESRSAKLSVPTRET